MQRNKTFLTAEKPVDLILMNRFELSIFSIFGVYLLQLASSVRRFDNLVGARLFSLVAFHDAGPLTCSRNRMHIAI